MQKPKRFYFYCNKLYYTYRIEYTRWVNGHDADNDWHGYDEWAIAVGFEPSLFRYQDWYYDGHTCKELTILGITFNKLYTYQYERLSNDR
jgi:hypothetical protein